MALTRESRWETVGMGVVLVAIGVLAAFPDALLQIRAAWGDQALADRACNPSAGPCIATFADGAAVTLRVRPEIVRATEPLTLEVEAPEPLRAVGVAMQGVEMNMGLVTVPLAARDGRYVGEGATPACTVERMTWRVDVDLGDRTAIFWLPVAR